LYASGETIAHDQIAATAQFIYEWSKVLEVIAVVRIGHDHVFPAGSVDT